MKIVFNYLCDILNTVPLCNFLLSIVLCRVLAQYATSVDEKAELLKLSQPEHKDAFDARIVAERQSIVTVLEVGHAQMNDMWSCTCTHGIFQ